MINVYRFAGLTIQIQSIHETVHELCKEYRSDGIPCFAVKTDAADIELEREKAALEDLKEGREIISWTDGYLETLPLHPTRNIV